MSTLIKLTPISLNCTGYYWRDFEGAIPSDALSAGLDSSGKPLYIGQAYFANTIIPGKIYENDPVVYYAWGMGERTATGDVKVRKQHVFNDNFNYLKSLS